ncbi:hypothetical protein MMC25_003369 [Agyrium rufum]|nr:hypothetical protein [Agyrium rufum]
MVNNAPSAVVGLGEVKSLTEESQKIIEETQKLVHLGIETTDFDFSLPKIVVVGDQSTCKSSLIEAMSGIKVPRKSGCCTRCPLEINIKGPKPNQPSDGPPWSCEVWISRSYVYEGALGDSAARSETQIGPWKLQDRMDSLFATLHSQKDIGFVLQLAQRAVLNPGKAHELFQPGQTTYPKEEDDLKFSPNIVRLDIYGSDLPRLAFLDLPGVIAKPPPGEQHKYLVGMIAGLVKQHIARPTNIVVLTQTVSHDLANSNAAQIVCEANAEKRTIGVLTKPDVILNKSQFIDFNTDTDRKIEHAFGPGGDLQQWYSVLNGTDHQLGPPGYFVVKNNQDELVSLPQARWEEDRFFRDELPWNHALFEPFRERFGVKKLQKELAKRLTEQINKCLPMLQDKYYRVCESNALALGRLPAPPTGNLAFKISKLLGDFRDQIVAEIRGSSSESSFNSSWNKQAEDFRTTLLKYYPVLELDPAAGACVASVTKGKMKSTPSPAKTKSVPKSASKSAARTKTTTNTSQDPVDLTGDPVTPSSASLPTIIKRPCTEDARDMRSIPAYVDNNGRDTCLSGDALSKVGAAVAKRFTITEVTTKLGQHSQEPGNHNDAAVFVDMTKLSLGHWEALVSKLIEDTVNGTKNMLNETISAVLAKYQTTELHRRLIGTCDSFIRSSQISIENSLSKVIALERSKPLTMDRAILHQYIQTRKNNMLDQRRKWRAEDRIDALEEAANTVWTDNFRDGQYKKAFNEVAVEDYEAEVAIMAKVQGYHDYAARRFADHVVQRIRGEFFEEIQDHLAKQIEADLDMENASEAYCMMLLERDKKIEEERRFYLDKEKRLAEAGKIFTGLAASSRSSASQQQQQQQQRSVLDDPTNEPRLHSISSAESTSTVREISPSIAAAARSGGRSTRAKANKRKQPCVEDDVESSW